MGKRSLFVRIVVMEVKPGEVKRPQNVRVANFLRFPDAVRIGFQEKRQLMNCGMPKPVQIDCDVAENAGCCMPSTNLNGTDTANIRATQSSSSPNVSIEAGIQVTDQMFIKEELLLVVR